LIRSLSFIFTLCGKLIYYGNVATHQLLMARQILAYPIVSVHNFQSHQISPSITPSIIHQMLFQTQQFQK